MVSVAKWPYRRHLAALAAAALLFFFSCAQAATSILQTMLVESMRQLRQERIRIQPVSDDQDVLLRIQRLQRKQSEIFMEYFQAMANISEGATYLMQAFNSQIVRDLGIRQTIIYRYERIFQSKTSIFLSFNSLQEVLTETKERIETFLKENRAPMNDLNLRHIIRSALLFSQGFRQLADLSRDIELWAMETSTVRSYYTARRPDLFKRLNEEFSSGLFLSKIITSQLKTVISTTARLQDFFTLHSVVLFSNGDISLLSQSVYQGKNEDLKALWKKEDILEIYGKDIITPAQLIEQQRSLEEERQSLSAKQYEENEGR